MHIVLIIFCVLLCVGIIVAIVGNMGTGVALDKSFRARMHRNRARRRDRGRGMPT